MPSDFFGGTGLAGGDASSLILPLVTAISSIGDAGCRGPVMTVSSSSSNSLTDASCVSKYARASDAFLATGEGASSSSQVS